MKFRKKLVFILAFAALAAVSLWAGSVISPQQLQSFISRSGNAAAVLYIGLFALLPAFFFPVAVLALAGGVLFGLL